VLSVQALILFTIFCFLIDENIKLKILACFFEITFLNILSVTCFEDPKAAIMTQKMLTGSRLLFCKIIPEAACDHQRIFLPSFLSLIFKPTRRNPVSHPGPERLVSESGTKATPLLGSEHC
jgi:hypothetical protein